MKQRKSIKKLVGLLLTAALMLAVAVPVQAVDETATTFDGIIVGCDGAVINSPLCSPGTTFAGVFYHHVFNVFNRCISVDIYSVVRCSWHRFGCFFITDYITSVAGCGNAAFCPGSYFIFV